MPTSRPYPSEWFDDEQNLQKFYTDERFRSFAIQVMDYLSAMLPEKVLHLHRYEGEKLEWVVRAVVLHIEGEYPRQTYFSNDYRSVFRQKWTEHDLKFLKKNNKQAATNLPRLEKNRQSR